MHIRIAANPHIVWGILFDAYLQNCFMQEIISQLTKKIGISEAQAKQALEMITNFIGDKIPMVKGQLNTLLGQKSGEAPPQVGGINLPGLG